MKTKKLPSIKLCNCKTCGNLHIPSRYRTDKSVAVIIAFIRKTWQEGYDEGVKAGALGLVDKRSLRRKKPKNKYLSPSLLLK
jgi:hypothetical protein